jgi:hypothetical protein
MTAMPSSRDRAGQTPAQVCPCPRHDCFDALSPFPDGERTGEGSIRPLVGSSLVISRMPSKVGAGILPARVCAGQMRSGGFKERTHPTKPIGSFSVGAGILPARVCVGRVQSGGFTERTDPTKPIGSLSVGAGILPARVCVILSQTRLLWVH